MKLYLNKMQKVYAHQVMSRRRRRGRGRHCLYKKSFGNDPARRICKLALVRPETRRNQSCTFAECKFVNRYSQWNDREQIKGTVFGSRQRKALFVNPRPPGLQVHNNTNLL